MNLQSEKAKSQQISETLEKQILRGILAPGARIQSVRALASKFGVSINLIQTVFDILEKKQLIERRHGSGTFIKEPESFPRGRIAFLFLVSRSMEESYHFQVFRAVCTEMHKQKFAVDLLSQYDDYDEIQKKYDGIVFSSTVEYKTLNDLVNSQTPCVVYGNVSGIEGLCEVNPDYFNGSVMAVDYLCNHNFKKIIFATFPSEDNLRNKVCYDGYREGLERNNIAFDPDLIWNFYDVKNKLESFATELKSGNYAFYVPNDTGAFYACEHLLNKGIEVPQEVSVIGFYNRDCATFARPPLTTIGFDLELMGKTLARNMCRMIAGESVESTIIPVKIIERGSIRTQNCCKTHQPDIVITCG